MTLALTWLSICWLWAAMSSLKGILILGFLFIGRLLYAVCELLDEQRRSQRR